MEIEHFFTCPYCWTRISFILDMSVEEQTYIEDCEVCCRPIEIEYRCVNGVLTSFEAEGIER